MMKETQRQNRMRRSPLVPNEDGKENDSSSNQCGLHHSNFALTEIHKRPHQRTAARAGQKGTGKIESADAMPKAFVHSGDDETRSHNCNRHVNKKSPAPGN